MTIQQILETAFAHHQAGRAAEAERLYRQALAIDPNHPDALHLLGLLYYNIGQPALAQQSIERAISSRPNTAMYHLNLGAVLESQGDFDRAIQEGRHAIALQADLPEAFYNLGKVYEKRLQWEDAIKCHRHAIALRPDWPGLPDAVCHLGYDLLRAGRPGEAIATYQDAIAKLPNFPKYHMNLAAVYYSQYQLDESVRSLRRAIALQPDYFEACNALAGSLKDIGDQTGAMEHYQRAIQLRPDFAAADSNRICLLHLCPDYDSQMLLREQRQWNQPHAEPFRPAQMPRKTNSSSRRLRIGYVSADFRNHVVARNILPLLRECNRRQFEIFCYSNHDQPDAMTAKLRAQADHWRSIVRMTDAAAADQIRVDEIDILVDLSLHTPGNRLQIFARKPAPVQITFAGYPGGTGLTAMDWRLTDPYLDPPGVGDENYVERSYRLPESFWCYDPAAMQWDPDGSAPPEVADLPALRNGFITFGCLNNFCKVNKKVLGVWGQTLASIENSRLVILAPDGSARTPVLDHLSAAGVSANRIEFVVQQSRSKYLREFNRIDIALDTFPYNGHTTSLDAMWMGVPVISRLGQTVVGRAGWSQASNLGLTDLVADSDERFTEIAVRYSADLPALAELRRTLRPRMLASPLCNARRFAENIQTAYRKIWAE